MPCYDIGARPVLQKYKKKYKEVQEDNEANLLRQQEPFDAAVGLIIVVVVKEVVEVYSSSSSVVLAVVVRYPQ